MIKLQEIDKDLGMAKLQYITRLISYGTTGWLLEDGSNGDEEFKQQCEQLGLRSIYEQIDKKI